MSDRADSAQGHRVHRTAQHTKIPCLHLKRANLKKGNLHRPIFPDLPGIKEEMVLTWGLLVWFAAAAAYSKGSESSIKLFFFLVSISFNSCDIIWHLLIYMWIDWSFRCYEGCLLMWKSISDIQFQFLHVQTVKHYSKADGSFLKYRSYLFFCCCCCFFSGSELGSLQ